MHKILMVFLVISVLTACSRKSDEPSRPDDAVIRGVHYIGVVVSDLDNATSFYENSANLQLVQNSVLASSTIDSLVGRKDALANTRLMKSNNAQLRFMQFKSPSNEAKNSPHVEVYGPGIAHVCYQVAKKTKAYNRFLDAGASHIGKREMVQLNPRRPVDYAYARDLDNIMFEVEHVDIEKLDLDAPPKYDYRIRHVSLATPNISRAVEFYSELLQEKKPRRLGRFFSLSSSKLDDVSGLPETKIKMAFFQVRNIELEIVQYTSHPTQKNGVPRPFDATGYNMIVFDVTDLNAAREKLLSAGGTVVGEPHTMDNGQIMYGRDLDGNLLGFQSVDNTSVFSSQNFKDNGI